MMITTFAARCAIGILALAGLALVGSSPAVLFAQGDYQTELRATIREAILADPRAGELSGEELKRTVELLASEADAEGVTAEDIVWRPEERMFNEGGASENTCGRIPVVLCILNEALGFSGGNVLMPLLLLLCSLALMFVLSAMIRMHHRDREEAAALSALPPPPVGGM